MYSLSAFRSYDIRGVRQTEIDEVFGLRIGYALGKHFLAQGDTPRILITADVRNANLTLIDHVLRGMKTAGIQQVENFGVSDQYPSYTYGICSTSLSYHIGMGVMDWTIVFSASHNTAEYVGMKIVDRDAKYIKTIDLKAMFEAVGDLSYAAEICEVIPHETSKHTTLFQAMKQKYASLDEIPQITMDYGNGAGVHYEQDFFREVGGDRIHHLFGTPDSDFSNHETDTSRFTNYEQLIQTVQERGDDFGCMVDGDVDRIGMCLPDGRVVTGDVILAIIAKQMLEGGDADRVGSREIFQEVLCSRTVRDVVEKYGGNLHIVRVGRGAFVDEVIEKNGLLAGETSAHILFKEYGTIEVPLLAFRYIFKERQNFESATAMIDAYMPYVRDQILHFACDDKDAVIEAVKEQYASYPQLTIDGVRVEGPDRWFTVRKSGTEPIIKVGLEGETQEIHDRILAEVRAMMTQLGAHEE